jgi:lysophospholipase L1-like esterase
MSRALMLALSPLLVAQALHTRAKMPRLPEAAGPRAGECGDGPLLKLLIVGDSSAAGVGVATQELALAGQLSSALAAACPARVQWQLVARSGVNSAQAYELLHELKPQPADVAVAVLGVNDVVDRLPPEQAMRARERLADSLRADFGVRHVVFAPLPPVHQFPGLPQPLRWLAGSEARLHDDALAQWTIGRDGVSHAPIAVTLGPDLMASDGFHPGEPLYRLCGQALATHVAERVWPRLLEETTP